MKWAVLLLALAGCGSYVPCSTGMVQATVCVQCGQAGGCAKQDTKCVKSCSSGTECTGAGETCASGLCQLVGCI